MGSNFSGASARPGGGTSGPTTPIVVTIPYNAPADSAGVTFPFAVQLVSAILRPTVVGSDGGAVTGLIRKVDSGTALASGTAMTAAGDLKGTANTNQVLALSATAAANEVAAGQTVGPDYTGTTTAAIGTWTLVFIAKANAN